MVGKTPPTGCDSLVLNSAPLREVRSPVPTFVPGLRLSQLYYESVVRPILAEQFPTLPYAAALIGYGSDVLGYDTERSTDHEWGPRLIVFLDDGDFDPVSLALDGLFRKRLPPTFMEYSTAFSAKDHLGVRIPVEATPGDVAHHIDFWTVRQFFTATLGWDPASPLSSADWLSFSSQKLLEVTAGAVFHDELGTLTAARAQLQYYPDDAWRYLLSVQWMRMAEEDPFIGRCHELRDAIGERLVAAHLVRDLVRLCFLIERRFIPYSKWLGTAFSQLAAYPGLAPLLNEVLDNVVWDRRQAALHQAYAMVVEQFNRLELVEPVPTRVSPFYERPYAVLHAERIAEALWSTLTPSPNRATYEQFGFVGSVDQLSDSTAFLAHARRTRAYRSLFRELD